MNFSKLFNRFRSEVTEEPENGIELVSLNAPNCSTTLQCARFLFNNCKNSSHSIQLFDSLILKEELQNLEKVLVIEVQIEESLQNLTQQELRILSQKCANKSVVIFLASKNEEKFLIYWKSKEIQNFFVFATFNEIPEENDKEFNEFVACCLAKSLENGHIGLRSSVKNRNSGGHAQPHIISDSRDFNLLLQAAEAGNNHVVKILCKMKIEANLPQKNVNAQILAWNNNHHDVVLTLVQENLIFPPEIEEERCSEDLKKFIAINHEFHEAVKTKDEDKILAILNENPKNNHFFNINNESASKIALDLKSFDTYEFLISHKVYLGNHEAFNDIWGNFSESERKILREIHFKYSMFSPEKHLHDIALNSGVAHDDREAKEKLNLVQYAFRILNGIPLIQIILMIVAASKKFKIIFDFKRDSVHVADPTADASTRGLFYIKGRIYVAAWHILHQATEKEAFGTMAHELCHYAMYIVFNNMAKPYYRKDKEGKGRFKEISRICKCKSGIEPIIDYVYDEYPQRMEHAELIVRVPHLIALYHDQPEKLKEIREEFIELFTFYEEVVVPEMQRVLPKIEDENQLEKKDKTIFKYKTLFIVMGILSIIGLIASIIIIKSIHKPTYSFNGLMETDKSKVRDGLINYKNVIVKFRDLFAKNSTAYKDLTSDHISQIFDGVPLDFSHSHFVYLNEQVYLDWKNLTKKLRDKFLNSNFSFQNETVNFKKLYEENSTAFNYLTSDQISMVLDGDVMTLGKTTRITSDFYLERLFEVKNEEASRIYIGNTESYYYIYYNSSKLIQETVGIFKKEGSKSLILSANAGTGKTAEFQHMSVNIKSKFPTRWVSYFDLKNYTKVYQKIKNDTKLEDIRDLLKVNLVFDGQSKFEGKVFEYCFDSGNFIVLWNGYDEIAPTYEAKVGQMFELIRNFTENVQFVCTRPFHAKRLKELLSIKPYTFVPFQRDAQVEYLKNQFEHKKIQQNRIDSLIEKVLGLMEGMSEQFNTPLMLKLFATICETEIDFELKNLYEIYSLFTKMQMQSWQSESIRDETLIKIVLTNSKFNILKYYQKHALMLLESSVTYQDYFCIKFRKLEILNLELPKEVSSEDVSRLGILYHNDKNEYEFVHRTFEEFFIAQYFIENIYNAESGLQYEEAELRITVFLLSFFYSSRIIFDFLSSYFLTQNLEESKVFSQGILKHFERSTGQLIVLIDLITSDLLPVLLNFFKPDHYFITKLLLVYESETFYTRLFNPIYYVGVDPSKILHHMREVLIDDYEFNLLLNGQNQRGKILFGMYCYEKRDETKIHISYKISQLDMNLTMTEYFEKVMMNLTIDEQKELFMLATSPKIYRVIVFTFDDYKYLWENYIRIFKNNEMKVPLKNAIYYSLYVDFLDIFEPKITFALTDDIIKYLLSWIENFFTDEEIFELFIDINVLNRVAHDRDRFEYLWKFLKNHTTRYQQREILKHFDDGNFIDRFYVTEPFQIIHRSLFSENNEAFLYIKDIYSNYFSLSELQNIMTYSNDYIIYIFGDRGVDTFEIFISYLKDLFKDDERMLKEFLMRMIKPTQLSIFQFYSGTSIEEFVIDKLKLLSTLLSSNSTMN